MSKQDFEKLCEDKCQYCKLGAKLSYRTDTKEYVHDIVKGAFFIHTICVANKIRKERDLLNGR